MVYTVWTANLFSVVEWCGAVSVGDDEDVRRREDLQGGFKCVGDESCRLVAWNHEAGVRDIRLNLTLAGVFGSRRVSLEEDEKRSECVTRVKSV